MASRAETTRDQFATALATITVANGYNNAMTTAQVSKAFPIAEDQLTVFPHIAIELGRSTVKFRDSNRSINDEYIELLIAAFVKADTETTHIATASKMQNAMESMVHDLKKLICTSLMTVNAASTTNPWVLSLHDNSLEFERVGMLGEQRNIGMVTCSLTVLLKNQNTSFTANS